MTKRLAKVIINYKVNHNSLFAIAAKMLNRLYLRELPGWSIKAFD